MSCFWCISLDDVVGHLISGVAAFAAIAVAIAAWKGKDSLESWANQQRFRREMEHAERILIAVYKLRDELNNIYGLFRILDKMSTQLTLQNSLIMEEDLDNLNNSNTIQGQVFNQRIDEAEEIKNSVYECIPISLSIFEKDVQIALKEMVEFFSEISVIAKYNTDFGNDEGKKMLREVLHRILGEKGKNNGSIDNQVNLIRSSCTKILQRSNR